MDRGGYKAQRGCGFEPSRTGMWPAVGLPLTARASVADLLNTNGRNESRHPCQFG